MTYNLRMELEKLIEKKDLMLYLRLRKEEIHQQYKKEIKKIVDDKRHEFTKTTYGRICEIKKMIQLIQNGTLKDSCKVKYSKYGDFI